MFKASKKRPQNTRFKKVADIPAESPSEGRVACKYTNENEKTRAVQALTTVRGRRVKNYKRAKKDAKQIWEIVDYALNGCLQIKRKLGPPAPKKLFVFNQDPKMMSREIFNRVFRRAA